MVEDFLVTLLLLVRAIEGREQDVILRVDLAHQIDELGNRQR